MKKQKVKNKTIDKSTEKIARLDSEHPLPNGDIIKNLNVGVGSVVPDPTDIPGIGDESMIGATVDALERKSIGKQLKNWQEKRKK